MRWDDFRRSDNVEDDRGGGGIGGGGFGLPIGGGGLGIGTVIVLGIIGYALGIDPSVEPEIHEYATKPGDIYLLCSDGLCDMVNDEDIGMTLSALGANLNLAAQQLVQMANDNGGRDNVSVILVRVLREYPGPRGVMAKMFAWLK